MKTSEPTIDFSWDMLNFPGSKFKGLLLQKVVYPQVEFFCSKLGSCMAGFSQVRWCPKRRVFFAFPTAKFGIIFHYVYSIYIYYVYDVYNFIEIHGFFEP